MAEYNNYIYNPKIHRWTNKLTGQQARLGNRIRLKNGDYMQLNSDGTITKVGSVSEGLTAEMRKKLGKSAFAEDVAMKSNLIKDRYTGKWRLDSDDTNTKTKTVDNRQYYLRRIGNSNKGRWTSFDTGLALSADKAQIQKAIDKKTESLLENKDKSIGNYINEYGVIGGATEALMDELGVKNEAARAVASLASNAVYMIPGVGFALGAVDAANAFRQGKIGEGLLELGMGVIPGGKILKTTKRLTKRSRFFKPKLVTPNPHGMSHSAYKTAMNNYNNTIKQYHTLTFNKLAQLNKGPKIFDKGVVLSDKGIKNIHRARKAAIGGGVLGTLVSSAKEYSNAYNQAVQEQAQLQNRINQSDFEQGLHLGRFNNTNWNEYANDNISPTQYQTYRNLIVQ